MGENKRNPDSPPISPSPELPFISPLQSIKFPKMSFSTLRLRRPEWYYQTPPLTSANMLKFAFAAFLFLLPSQISRRISRRPVKAPSTSGITALDGLRGISCLIVFNEHFSASFSNAFYYGYGVEGHSTYLQLPLIRTFWCGSAMVAIFFVISGYVLSYKPLKFIRAKEHTQFHTTLSSSTFRRAVRLYLPSMIAVLICGLLTWLGIFDKGAANAHNPDLGLHFHENTPPRFDSFPAQMADAAKNALHMFSLWEWGRENVTPGDYDQHLWTILVEFRASMVLFLTLLMTSKLQQFWRLIVVGFFIVYCICTDRRDVFLFLCGMAIAELDMIRKESLQTGGGLQNEVPDDSKDADRKIWVAMFAIGFYLTSAPVYGAETTLGYQFLASLIPTYYHDAGIAVQAIGAILMVWAVANSSILKPIFVHPIASYLGKISYALYLVHGNVIKSLLYGIIPWLFESTGAFQYMVGLIGAWMMGVLLVGPLTIWLSDVFWRAVDLPSVSFARWLEKGMTDEAKEGTELGLPGQGTRLV